MFLLLPRYFKSLTSTLQPPVDVNFMFLCPEIAPVACVDVKDLTPNANSAHTLLSKSHSF